MGGLTYYDYAENDYKFVADAYKANLKGNALGYLAEQACEKYLKHSLCVAQGKDASIPGEAPVYSKNETHHPGKLARKLRDFGITVPGSFIHKMNTMASYYRDVRYPGYYTSHTIDKEEIEDCMKCMIECRSFVQNLIKTLEIEAEAKIDNEEIDFGIY